MLSNFYRFRAEFFDADSMGVVWHGNYIKYLESARCSMLDELGCNYVKMKENDFCLPIIKLDVKYIKYIKFNQKIKVQIEILDYDTLLKLRYKIYDDENEELLSVANTTQVAVRISNEETLFELPKVLKDAFKNLKGER